MLKVRDLSIGIGRDVIAGLSFDVNPGELLAVVGPSGAGKSTLLFTLCGELRSRQGSVHLLDKSLSEWKPRERARHVAVLPQESSVAFDFSAEEVVLLGRTTTGGPDESAERVRAREALTRVGVGPLAGRRYRSLSGGERQRVQLARVMNQLDEREPRRLLLLDEPTASLDIAAAHACMEALLDFARAGAAVVMSVHDLTLSSQYADRVMVLSGGAQRALGEPDESLSQEVLSQAFECEVSVTTLQQGERPVVVSCPSARARRLRAGRGM